MKVIAGQVEADHGERFLQPGCHVTYLDQEPDLSGYDTLHDYVASGLSEASQEETYRVDIILEDIKLDPLLDPTKLSGGEGRRAALARAMSRPTISIFRPFSGWKSLWPNFAADW